MSAHVIVPVEKNSKLLNIKNNLQTNRFIEEFDINFFTKTFSFDH